MVLQLLRDQMSFSDLFLLFLQITGHLDQLHSVQERPGDRLQTVSRCNEQHLTQIVIDIQIVVMERAVLFRIQHFEQSRRRITLIVSTYLIDLVQYKNRVTCTAFLDAVDDPTR